MYALISLIAPTAHAAAIDPAAFGKVVDPIISNVVNPIVELMFAVALIVFVYGVLKVVTNETTSEEHAEGKRSMYYGITGIFIMVSAWGIINIVANTVGQFR